MVLILTISSSCLSVVGNFVCVLLKVNNVNNNNNNTNNTNRTK